MKKICEITAESLPSIDEIINKAEDVCPVQWAANVARTAHEYVCGHGTFCRDGMFQLYLIPEDIIKGRGTTDDLEMLERCCNLIIAANECELSVKTAEFVKKSLLDYADDWKDHITRHRCAAMQCASCYTLYIDPALCDGCGKCLPLAPAGVIAGGEGLIHVVKKDDSSIKTAEFLSCCPKAAIKKAGVVKPAVPADPVPVGSFGAGAGGGRRRRRG